MLRACAAALALLALAGAAQAQAPHAAAGSVEADASDYARDQITVSTEGRSRTLNPTATCLVWANAEGFGVGPAQLGGLHGLTLTLVVRPLAGESPKPFAQGFAEARAAFPDAPGWLMGALSANKAAIETACGEDHPNPFMIHRITRADTRRPAPAPASAPIGSTPGAPPRP